MTLNIGILTYIAEAQKEAISKNNQLAENQKSSWYNAFNKAVETLPNVTFNYTHDTLAITSSDKNRIYIATTRTCQCPAFTESGVNPKPCYHRAAHTLLRLYTNFVSQATKLQ